MLSFKQFMMEGNPLARVHKFDKTGRQFSVVSAERSHLSPEENKKRHQALKDRLRKKKIGYREAQGYWDGVPERSLLIPARKTGKKSGETNLRLAKRLGKSFDQDTILHKHQNTTKTHGTTPAGRSYTPRTGSDKGGLHYNRPDARAQTELRPGKKKTQARFTTTYND